MSNDSPDFLQIVNGCLDNMGYRGLEYKEHAERLVKDIINQVNGTGLNNIPSQVLIDTNDPASVEKTVKFLNHHIDEIISKIGCNNNDVQTIALKKILVELLPLKNKRELFADSNEGFCAFVRVEYCVSFISELLKVKNG